MFCKKMLFMAVSFSSAVGFSAAYANNLSLSPTASAEVKAAARDLEQSISNTVWKFTCDGVVGEWQFAFDSSGKITLNDTWREKRFSWKVIGQRSVNLEAPDGSIMAFTFSRDKKTFKHISEDINSEGAICNGSQITASSK
jgi:hypothetical protein